MPTYSTNQPYQAPVQWGGLIGLRQWGLIREFGMSTQYWNWHEWVVREYLETQGFLVCQPRKYVAVGRHRKAEEEFDFLVVNPGAHVHIVPEQIMLDSTALRGITRAMAS